VHGKKSRVLVHIGSVDAPVTIAEINAAIAECVSLKQAELHVLGWEWEMGLYDLMVDEAKKQGVKLLLLQIPREVMEQQAADKGDVQFRACVPGRDDQEAPEVDGNRGPQGVRDPNTELIRRSTPEGEVSDYIGLLAVDWDHELLEVHGCRQLPGLLDRHVRYASSKN